MLNVILVPIYTGVMLPGSYGEVIVIFAYFAIFNVFLAYGMETTFFRFYKEADQRKKVVTTSLLSILATTLSFLIIGVIFKGTLSELLEIKPKYIGYVFGTTDQRFHGQTSRVVQLVNEIQSSWTAFAHNGSPATLKKPWPSYDDDFCFMLFDHQHSHLTAHKSVPKSIDFWSRISDQKLASF